MVKRVFLVIIMMISTIGLFTFGKKDTGIKTSIASFYHDKFNGRKTANGEIFSNNKLTAANKTLPFGTKLKVTNIKTRKSVIVRVNDRGPYHSARALDLTKVAFNTIGNPSSGTVAVEYEIVND